MRRRLSLILLSLVTTPGWGQEDFFGEIGLENRAADEARPTSAVTLVGSVEEKIGYGLEQPADMFSRDYEGLSQLETDSYLRVDWQVGERVNFRFSGALSVDGVYQVERETAFSEDEIDQFETRFELRDFFMETEVTNRLYLKLGYQVVAWGVSETLQVSDLVSPLNQFTFGHQDIEDLRWEVPALLATWSVNDWSLDAVVTYRAGTNRIAPAYDEFDPFIRQRQAGAALVTEAPDEDTETLLRASTHVNGGDFSVVLGDVNSNSLYIDQIDFADDGNATFQLRQDRFQAIAFAANMVKGPWLLFAEAGAHVGKALPSRAQPEDGDVVWLEKDQVLSVAGVEYSGVNNLRLRFELNNVHTADHDEVAVEKDVRGYAARLMWDGIRNRLHVVGAVNRLANGAGDVARLNVDYELSDSLDLGMLYVRHGADRAGWLEDFEHNDIVQLRLKYSFQN